MTVSSTTRRAGPYPGNGVATSFPFTFKVFTKSDIAVVFANSSGVESTLVLDSDYSVTLNADQNTNPGGSITYPISGSPMLSTQALAIVGGLGYGQTTALPSGGAYNASIVERALDRITILTQQVLEIANRGVQLAFTTASNVSSRLPAPRAFSVLGWSSDGLSMTNYDPGTLGVSVSYAAWQTQTFNGTGAQTVFVLTNDAGVASNCDVAVGGVAQTPGVNFSYDSLTKTITFLTGAPPVGTNNVAVRYGQVLPQGTIVSANITDSTTTGRAVLTAASQAAARTAIGAAASGANADITSLPALASVPSVVAQYSNQIKTIGASVASNALTITSGALSLDFRSTTLGSGTVTTVSGTPSNLVVPSTATLGTVNAVQSDIAVLALNNAGTIELAVVNLAGGVDLSETGVISTTAISAASNAANVVYSTTARTSAPYRVIGVVRSTQATAGTWATAPSLVQGQGGQAMTAMQSLGYGQTWQTVTRTLTTTYYNTTGKPIFLQATATGASAGSARIKATITSGASSYDVTASEAAAPGTTSTLYVVIPPGASYVLSNQSGTFSGTTCGELR